MQHLHPLKHSAALQGEESKEELNFMADPLIQKAGTFVDGKGRKRKIGSAGDWKRD